MTKDSASSTMDPGERERRLQRLAEAARRAVWDATEGPEHLRTGRFHPGTAEDDTADSDDAPAKASEHS